MTKLELLKELNNTLSILAWPIVVLVIVYWFREVLSGLASRVSALEGRIGKSQLRLEVQQVFEKGAKRADELESEGKVEEAEQVASAAAEVFSQLFGLTDEDIEYLVSLSNGGNPKRLWGPIHLVRSGLIEFEGGHLTNEGLSLINEYKSLKQRRNES